MGDLAQRPRGGWQFGNRRRASDAGRSRDERGRLLLPDGRVDPDPSCFMVRRLGPGVFRVEHSLDPDQPQCCRYEIRQTPEDLEAARAQGIHVDIVTLHREPECVRDRKSA